MFDDDDWGVWGNGVKSDTHCALIEINIQCLYSTVGTTCAIFRQDYKYVAFTVYNVPNTVYLTRNYNF